jgi:hypothetical protein
METTRTRPIPNTQTKPTKQLADTSGTKVYKGSFFSSFFADYDVGWVAYVFF